MAMVPGEYSFVNDPMTRYNPRAESKIMAAYAIFDGIHSTSGHSFTDIMKEIMSTDFTDLFNKKFYASDGKNCILGVRYYPGLYDWVNRCLVGNGPFKIRLGTTYLTRGSTNLRAEVVATDTIQWFTQPLTVPNVAKKYMIPTTNVRAQGGYAEEYLNYMCEYELFLPYYGFLKLNAGDVVNHTIQLFYNIDIFTGFTTIDVVCKRQFTDNIGAPGQDEVCYSVSCQVGLDIPLTPNLMADRNMCNVLNGISITASGLGAVVKTGLGVATGGISLAGSAANLVPDINLPSSNLVNSSVDSANKASAIGENIRNVSSNVINTVKNGADVLKADITPSQPRSNGSSANTAHTGVLVPFLNITLPVSKAPLDIYKYYGMAVCESMTLNDCKGFTQISSLSPDNDQATAPKYMNEIINLLQAGVYL